MRNGSSCAANGQPMLLEPCAVLRVEVGQQAQLLVL